jgi:hypothetical protein
LEFAVNAESGIQDIGKFAGILRPEGCSFAPVIVVPGGGGRKPDCRASTPSRVCAQRVEREFDVIALAEQHAERAITLTAVLWRRGKAEAQ